MLRDSLRALQHGRSGMYMFGSCRVQVISIYFNRTALERAAIESDSLVGEKIGTVIVYIPKYHRAREILWESAPTMG